MNAFVIAAAFVLDRIFGDPQWLPHPVRAMGWMIRKSEMILRPVTRGAWTEKIAGVLLVFMVVVPVYVVSLYFISHIVSFSVVLGTVLATLAAYTTLAARSLADAARGVLAHLDAGDLVRARAELSMIVGRDTADLDEPEIVRAVIETVAENASDGVIAPIFYLALGGPALALAYKAVNTLDSMVGYKNDRYLHFGWAAAKFDDIANYLPARISAALISLAAGVYFVFASGYRSARSAVRNSWRITLRDGKNHPSPNSGFPESAMAGALGIRLGGPSTYGGRLSIKPFIGDMQGKLDKKLIENSVQLMYCATSFAVLGSIVIRSIV